MLHRIMYCSRNHIEGSLPQVAVEIASILSSSRRRNAAMGVTGALFFNGEAFAQVIEGPHEAVDAIYASICVDPRHSQIVKLADVGIVERDFKNWSMAYAARVHDVEYGSLRFEELKINPKGFASQTLAYLKSLVGAHA